MKIQFYKIKEDAIIPKMNHIDDAGIDFFSNEDIVVRSKSFATCQTGIAWQPVNVQTDKKVYLQMQSRSGIAFKSSVELTNAGVIDQSYRGEIGMKFYNYSDKDFNIKKGDKIAQGIVKLLPYFEIEETFELENTIRGSKGFGSSGK